MDDSKDALREIPGRVDEQLTREREAERVRIRNRADGRGDFHAIEFQDPIPRAVEALSRLVRAPTRWMPPRMWTCRASPTSSTGAGAQGRPWRSGGSAEATTARPTRAGPGLQIPTRAS